MPRELVGPRPQRARAAKAAQPFPEIFGEGREGLVGAAFVTEHRGEIAEDLGAVATKRRGGRCVDVSRREALAYALLENRIDPAIDITILPFYRAELISSRCEVTSGDESPLPLVQATEHVPTCRDASRRARYVREVGGTPDVPRDVRRRGGRGRGRCLRRDRAFEALHRRHGRGCALAVHGRRDATCVDCIPDEALRGASRDVTASRSRVVRVGGGVHRAG